MSGLRQFVTGDETRVANLIWKVLHGRQGPAPHTLPRHLVDLFLRNPWAEDGIVSRVFEDSQGNIVGFFGALPRRMTLQGKPVRLAFGSNFVVDPESRASMVAMQLVRTFMKGSQDISITDSANEMSRTLLRSLGFSVVPVYSLQWSRPLRPSQYAMHALERRSKSRGVKVAASFAGPLCSLVDGLAARIRVSPFLQVQLQEKDPAMTTDELLHCLNTIPSRNWLLPEYDKLSLQWVLDFIAERKVFGELRRASVRNSDGKTIGWYIYTLVPGNVGEVLQIGAAGQSLGNVLDHLFRDAWNHGLIGLHGRMEPQFMQELTDRGCFFFRHGSWTLAHSKQTDLLSLLHSGTTFFSRLDGEWAFRHGGGET